MRFALLADVHANLEALDVVLEELDRLGCDGLLCAGDLVGYGPDPNVCVRILRARDVVAVAGNHDLMALERLPLDRCVPDGQRAIRWTRRVLDPDLRLYLDELPLVRQVFPGIAVCHGSLDDPDEYVATRAAAVHQLRLLRERFPTCHLLVCGHTHRAALHWESGLLEGLGQPGSQALRRLRPAAVRRPGPQPLPAHGPWLVNPGSVGQSRDRRALARFALYDTDRREIEFIERPYPVEICQSKLWAAGLTTRLYLPRRNAALRLARLARRGVSRLRGILRPQVKDP